MAKASKKVKIRMRSSENNGYTFTTTKNSVNTPGKLKLKRYDPVARKHVEFTETKIK